MCYYVYGAVSGDIHNEEYQVLDGKYRYKLRRGTKHDVKLSVRDNSDAYRVTDWCCDCDSDLGKKNPEAAQIKALEALIQEIRNTHGAQYVYLSKTWNGKGNKSEIKIKLDDIDLKIILAELRENCLYTFEV